jgi:elongator complex protein 1
MNLSGLCVPSTVQARRNNRTDLIDGSIIPGALDLRTQIGDDLEEMKEQLRKQSARLKELEEKRKNDPGN